MENAAGKAGRCAGGSHVSSCAQVLVAQLGLAELGESQLGSVIAAGSSFLSWIGALQAQRGLGTGWGPPKHPKTPSCPRVGAAPPGTVGFPPLSITSSLKPA